MCSPGNLLSQGTFAVWLKIYGCSTQSWISPNAYTNLLTGFGCVFGWILLSEFLILGHNRCNWQQILYQELACQCTRLVLLIASNKIVTKKKKKKRERKKEDNFTQTAPWKWCNITEKAVQQSCLPSLIAYNAWFWSAELDWKIWFLQLNTVQVKVDNSIQWCLSLTLVEGWKGSHVSLVEGWKG